MVVIKRWHELEAQPKPLTPTELTCTRKALKIKDLLLLHKVWKRVMADRAMNKRYVERMVDNIIISVVVGALALAIMFALISAFTK